MYKFKRAKQIAFTDFNQPQGLQMNPNNRWVKKAAMQSVSDLWVADEANLH